MARSVVRESAAVLSWLFPRIGLRQAARKLCLFILSFGLISGVAWGENTSKHELSKLSWLEGCWYGEGLGGEISLCWMKSRDDRYTGVFQLERDGELSFVELIMLSEIDGTHASRILHFSPDFTAWESDGEYVEFPLLEIGADYARFESKTYKRVDPNELHIEVLLSDGNGNEKWETFEYRRQQ